MLGAPQRDGVLHCKLLLGPARLSRDRTSAAVQVPRYSEGM